MESAIVLKTKFYKFTKGITFQAWLIFTVFASVILLVLWFLQLSLITPYYRNAKINSVQTITDSIENMITDNKPLSLLEQVARDNSLCLIIVDEFNNVTEFNGIGSGCYILSSNTDQEFDFIAFQKSLRESENHEASAFVEHGSEMLVFGREIHPNLGKFTILINARITPEKAGLVLIQNQFVTLTIIVLLVATLASLLISRKVAKPFIVMTEKARKLANGNFDINFTETKEGYNEFNDLAASLNYATDKLKHIDEQRMDLIANVSHDIRTPLTMILAYSEMIDDFSKNDEKLLLEHLDVIRSEALYLDELIKDILELSTLESGNFSLNLAEFNLNALIKRAVEHFTGNITFTYDGNYNVLADETKINQVVYNFLNNALLHAKAKEVRINLRAHDDKVYVEVIDDGIGIDEVDLADIWERYNKLNKNFHRERNSTGLGLSISKSIINAHGEEVGVISELYQGSTFYFTLTPIK